MTERLESINPATEAAFARFPAATPDEIKAANAEADAVQQGWRPATFCASRLAAGDSAGRSRRNRT